MKRAIGETNRRRKAQDEYNKAHGIVPKTIIKEVKSTLNITKKRSDSDDIPLKEIPDEIEKLKALMKIASGQLDFERAIEIREKIAELKLKLRRLGK
jgi:excinuclease ABC subunit B